MDGCLNFVANQMMFADAFTNKEPAPDFDGHQCIQTSLFNGEIFPCSSGRSTDQISETWYFWIFNDSMNAFIPFSFTPYESDVNSAHRGKYSPARIAGTSLNFGGVISAAAYLPTTFKTGRDFVANAEIS